ncbi:hypothetical protein [Aquisalibacillus elongatus]|uniref:Uncharacterized protein n=1 Tax=Aquisalibacillus elongatus TaxID=485577 RepID=A0A3N5BEW2_9BACI|nr:hypothetical protein [Aquisalibacillus elongatus]RPF55419.1 hypothetical protein EDC24_0292 [Aquisalibacillus elongatus]
MKNRLLFFVIIILLVGCNDQSNNQPDLEISKNLDAEDILENNPDADILMVDDIIYKNAKNINWVQEKNYTLGEKIGVVEKVTDSHSQFDNFSATKLPKGAEIYEPKEKGDIYIVVVDEKEIRYLGLREG